MPRGGYVDKVLRISLVVLVLLAVAVAIASVEAWLLYVTDAFYAD